MNGSKTAPLIGIVSALEQAQTGVWNMRSSVLFELYIRAITDVGGTVVVLPPQPLDQAAAANLVASLDGLVLSGGADIDPRRYGQPAHSQTTSPRQDRDDFEEALIRAALEIDLPILGICRGAQMLNVALGGDLIQHLPDQVGDTRYQLGQARFNPITVEVTPGTKIAETYGEQLRVTAPLYHHQAIGRVAEALTVTSRTADGVIESVELAEARFCVAVQWHPEAHPEDRRLFRGLLRAAREHRATRLSTPPQTNTSTAAETRAQQ